MYILSYSESLDLERVQQIKNRFKRGVDHCITIATNTMVDQQYKIGQDVDHRQDVPKPTVIIPLLFLTSVRVNSSASSTPAMVVFP